MHIIYHITDGVTIPKGIDIAISIYALHHDQKYFPEPFKFKPERFLCENSDAVFQNIYIPFSRGPRDCIGRFSVH